MTLLGAEFGFLEVAPAEPADRRADREVVLLLHGLSSNKMDWRFPAWRQVHWDHARVPANRRLDNQYYPPTLPWNFLPAVSLSDLRDDVRCWSGVLRGLGHTVINFNQDRPAERLEVALTHFEERIAPYVRDEVLTGALAGKRVTLLCHSRGGILARAYLRRHPEASAWIGRVITLCSPHQGSLAANAKQRLIDAASTLALPSAWIIPAITRITGWVAEGPGARQLLPDDPIFATLALPAELPEIEFATFGGTSVRFSRVYGWFYTLGSYVPGGFPDVRFDWEQFPVEMPLASPLLDALPDLVVDDEQEDGRGDGLVTDRSARLPGAPHRSLPINHAEAL